MDVVDLRTLMAVAEHGGVTLAARELNTVQSNVTTRIRQLEMSLGVDLFERHSRGMRLTRAGQRLLPYAKRIQVLMRQARAAARGEAPNEGPLRIGSMETTAAIRLPVVLARMRREHPTVSLALETGPTAQLLQALHDHRLDVVLVCGPLDHPSLLARVVFKERLVLVAPLACDTELAVARHLQDGGAALMFKEGCSYRQRFKEWLTHRGWTACATLEMGTLEGILGCVAAGVGVAMLPHAVIEASPLAPTVRVHELDDDRLANVQTLCVTLRTDTGPEPLLQHFINAFEPSVGAVAG